MTDPSRPPPTSDRLRKDIDRGKADDKVDHPDPAAAPLGTDDEAAGHAPGTPELAQEKLREAPRKRSRAGPVALVTLVAALLAIIAIVLATS